MNDVLETFVEDLQHTRFAPVADALRAALTATDLEADYNVHATVLYEALAWAIGHTNRSVEERLTALWKLVEYDGRKIELHEFTGWPE
jgi:hypothetical protein